MLCLAGLQKTAVSQSYVVKKLQPSAFFWTMQFVPQYVYEETSSLDSLFESEEFVRLFDRKADQNLVAGWIYFEIIVVVEHASERSGRPECLSEEFLNHMNHL
jgi:hypothetical protein